MRPIGMSRAIQLLVTGRLEFEIVCPNNHNQSVSFTREELEDRLKADGLVFHCNTCDSNWTPRREEIARFREAFDKAARDDA